MDSGGAGKLVGKGILEMTRDEVYVLINKERVRQDWKWGTCRDQPDIVWLAILSEELGEIAQAILKRDFDNLEVEIIQLAAVAVAWMENVKNHNNGNFKGG